MTALEVFILKIKRMRWYFYIPLILIFLIHPIYLILNGLYGNSLIRYSSIESEIISEIIILYPFTGLLWPLWCLYDYMDIGEGELSAFYHKVIWPDLVAFYLCYAIIVIIACKAYTLLFQIEWMDYYIMAIEAVTIFGYGLIYSMAFQIKSMPSVITILLLYYFCICVGDNEYLSKYNYARLFNLNKDYGMSSMALLILAAFILFLWGARQNRLYYDY